MSRLAPRPVRRWQGLDPGSGGGRVAGILAFNQPRDPRRLLSPLTLDLTIKHVQSGAVRSFRGTIRFPIGGLGFDRIWPPPRSIRSAFKFSTPRTRNSRSVSSEQPCAGKPVIRSMISSALRGDVLATDRFHRVINFPGY